MWRFPSFPSVRLRLRFLSLLYLPLLVPSSSLQKQCPSPLFRQSRSLPPFNGTSPHYSVPIHFYAITQDCQFVLARPDQLSQLRALPVALSPAGASFAECAPSRIKLLWSLNSPSASLLLLQQRAHNTICLLPIEMPFSMTADSSELFSYSLRNSLRHFAHCHVTNSTLHLDPNLGFVDSLYADILYFLDSSSTLEAFWTVHQFDLSPSGHLRPRDTFRRVKPMLENIFHWKNTFLRDGSPILLASDPQRKRLFAVPRDKIDLEAKAIRWTCPFDLIYRPRLARLRPLWLFPRSTSLLSPGSQITGFDVDRNVAVFTESARNSLDTFVFVAKLHGNNAKMLADSHCVLKLSYGAKFGVISDQTLQELRNKGPLPSMVRLSNKIESTRDHLLRSNIIASSTQKAPRGHVISLLKAQTTAPLKTTKKVVVDRIVPFWKTTASTTTTTISPMMTTERKLRLKADGEEDNERNADGDEMAEDGGQMGADGDEMAEEGGKMSADGAQMAEVLEPWSSDYERLQQQQQEEDAVIPLTDHGTLGTQQGPAFFRAKTPPAEDKNASAALRQTNAGSEMGRKSASGTASTPLFLPIILALTILFSGSRIYILV